MSDKAPRLRDPGLPEHIHRQADVDPAAAKKAERQVAILFSLSALGTVLFIYSYIWIHSDRFVFIPVMGSQNEQQLYMGLGLAASLLFIGLGAVHWAKTLMPDTEVIAERHDFRSEEADRVDFVAMVKEQGAASGLGRRSLIKRSLGISLGLIGLTPLVALRDLGPLPKKSLEETN